MAKCDHKTWVDFVLDPNVKPAIWRCSGCQATGAWTKDWEYFGSIECPRCWTAAIESVRCPACVAKDPKPEAAPKARRQTADEKRKAKLRDKIARLATEMDALRTELGDE